jgi:alkylation response protein AidB-like acyl-CoA dehydrogenase
LIPSLRARAESTERERRVSQEVMHVLRDAELFKLMQPAHFGGFEYGFTELMDINFEIGQGCGSTAWCASFCMLHQWLVALFPLEAQEEVWQDPATIVAVVVHPAGKCEVVSGGYRISGKWSFASNCDNVEWLILGVMVPPDPDRETAAQWKFVLVPRAETEIEDTWFSAGLGGTGTKTIVIKEDVFVPAHRTLVPQDPFPPGSRLHSNPLYRMPFSASIPFALASPALGIVQGALDEFIEWTSGRVTRRPGAANRMKEFSHVQSRIAAASGALDAAWLLLRRDVCDIESAIARGEDFSVDKRIRNRRDHGYALKLAVIAIDSLFEAIGAEGLMLSYGIQRAWRDVHAIALHPGVYWESTSTMYGRHRLGLELKDPMY